MTMKDAISEIAGQAELAQQGKGAVYRALRTLMCASCERVIAEDELFTRHSVTEGGLRILPKCQQCVPFTLLPAAKSERSTLIQSLLSPNPAPLKASITQEDKERRKKVDEAVQNRLGPALAHSRRKRS